MNSILSAISNREIFNVNPSVVISNNKDAPGLEIAKKKFNISTEVIPNDGSKGWDYDKKIYAILNQYNVLPSNGLICLAGYMKLLSSELVDKYRLRIMNIHPSLLPSFSGLHAQKQALEYGVKISGCTVHFVDSGLDSGPIILQEALQIKASESLEDITSRILELEHKLYPLAVKLFAEGKLKTIGRVVQI